MGRFVLSTYKVINSGIVPGREVLELEKYLLEKVSEPTLHFYRFDKPTVTYGHNFKAPLHLNLEVLDSLGFDHGHRLTPGGAIFHLWDYAFSVIIPLENLPFFSKVPASLIPAYAFKYFNSLVKQSLENFAPFAEQTSFIKDEILNHEGALESCKDVSFCMGNPTRLDIMKGDKKVCGAAEIVYKNNLLHHGSISLAAPDEDLLKKTLKNPSIVDKMLQRSFYFSSLSYKDDIAMKLLQAKIEKALFETFNKQALVPQENY